MSVQYYPSQRRIEYLRLTGRECKTCLGTGEYQKVGSKPCCDCEGTGEAPINLGAV